jgi:hypothetical protein
MKGGNWIFRGDLRDAGISGRLCGAFAPFSQASWDSAFPIGPIMAISAIDIGLARCGRSRRLTRW